jgi:CheY-like chemotaxis protein
VEVAPDVWPARADAAQIAQVVQNLVINGAEAMAGSGRMSVQVDNRTVGAGDVSGLPPGPYLRIQVTDQGEGIPSDLLGRIFDPYFSTRKSSRGLGLAIAHSVVRRHGGSIGVRSQPGDGAVFDVLLPASPGVSPRAAVSTRGSSAPGSALVMDDEPLVRDFLQSALERLGWHVATVKEGAEAVRLFAEARAAGASFDVVLLDLTVRGGMGGVATLAALRELDPAVRAIVTSGYSEDPVLACPTEYGFAAVLAKPFTLERLRVALADAQPAPRVPPA